MKKLLIGLLLLIGLKASSQTAYFNTVDSLKNYINQHIRNDARNAFNNLRLNTSLQGIAQFLDSARLAWGTGGGGTADGNNYSNSLNLNAGVLTLGRFGLGSLTTNIVTTHVPEGTNLYFTTPRARASLVGDYGISYNSTDGTIKADTASLFADFRDTLDTRFGLNIAQPNAKKTQLNPRVVGVSSLAQLRAITSLTATDTQFVFRFTDYTNRIIKDYQYDPNDASTADDSVTCIVAGTKRFKIYYQDYVLANWWPLKHDGTTDDSYYMQKAIDFAINTTTNGRTAKVKVLAGVYAVKYLNIWRPTGGGYNFVTCTIEGAAPTYDVTGGLSPTTTFKLLDQNAFILNVQFGRNCVIRNIAFWGPQAQPPTLAETITWTDSDWTSGGRNNQYSPQAAIVTDAFHDKMDSSLMHTVDFYPGQAAKYIGTTNSGTSGLKIEHCAIYNFITGIMVSPNPYSQNGDNIVMEHGYVGNCRSVWATGQPQSRANQMIDVYSLGQCKYLINGREYGLGNGAPPSMDHCNIAGVHKYLFDFFGNLAGLDATDSHFELIWALGRSGLRPVNFTNCYLEFVDFANLAYQPPVIYEGGQVNFVNGALSRNDNIGKMGFVFNCSQGVNLNGTWLYGGPVINANNTGLLDGEVKYNNVRLYSSGRMLDEAMNVGYGTTGFWNGLEVVPGMKFFFGDMNANVEITGQYKALIETFETKAITLDNTTKTGYFKSGHPEWYTANDFLVSDGAINDATDIFASARGAIGMVTSISVDTVRFKFAASALVSGNSYDIRICRFLKFFTPMFGDVDGTDTIRNVKKSPGAGFAVGDHIRGRGIPDGTKVKYVDYANGKIGITQVGTIATTGTPLYDAEYDQYFKVSDPSTITTNAVVRKGDIAYRQMQPFGAAGQDTAYAWLCTTSGVAGGSPAPVFKAIKVSGSINENDIAYSDITLNNVTSTKHGLAPKSPGNTAKFLDGGATPAFSDVDDADIVTSDVTTNDVSTSKHGFMPKAPNDAQKFFNGAGSWVYPTLRQLLTTGGFGTAVAGAGAGTSPTNSTSGTDASGKIDITTGTTPSASATVITITFTNSFSGAPNVVLTPGNAAAAALSGNGQVYISSTSTTQFVVTVGSSALAAGTQYVWYYHVIK